MRSAELQRDVDRRFDLPFTLRIPHSTFRITMSVQAIAWSPTGAVRIIDQRALPETRIERDLDSAEAVAAAIRTLQVRGAPLIGIAAAMGLVAGTRELRGAPREQFLARLGQLVELLAAARPTAVNLRWALDRMASVAAALSGDGSALWERHRARADLPGPRSRSHAARLRGRDAARAARGAAHGVGAVPRRDPVHPDRGRGGWLADAPGECRSRPGRCRSDRGERRLREQDRHVPARRAGATPRRAVLLRRAVLDHRRLA